MILGGERRTRVRAVVDRRAVSDALRNAGVPERPAYRYLEPMPATWRERMRRCAQWSLLISAVLWLLIFAAGFVIARS